jgi:hypothetical protein
MRWIILVLVLAGCATPIVHHVEIPPNEGPPSSEACHVPAPLPPQVLPDVDYHLTDARLRWIVEDVARRIHQPLVLAHDVTGTVSLDLTVPAAKLPRLFERVIAGNGLHARRVGSILVVARAPLESADTEFHGGEIGRFAAWGAPAREWFALLERVSGVRVEHGDAPIDVDVEGVQVEEVQRATALASFVPCELAAPRDACQLRATVTRVRQPLALVGWGPECRIVAAKDEFATGVWVRAVFPSFLALTEGKNAGRDLERPEPRCD